MAVKKLANTDLIPNPLHEYASYTYSWSLWWLDVADYNRLMDSTGLDDALSWNPGPKSFVVAEDGGVYPKRRQPNTLGLNYHIQNVQFETVVAPNKTSKSSNMIRGTMTIIEPYGVTLIDTLVAAAFDGTAYNNYCDNPYMLQLEFRGYDDAGDEIPKSKISTYNKKFPVRILEMKMEVTSRGTEYRITFVPMGGMAHQNTNLSHTPKQLNITAGTVDEFFNGPEGLGAQLRDYQTDLIRKNNATYADGIFFKIDPAIAETKILNESKVSLAKANPKTDKIDLKQSTFAIPAGTPILDIITKVMAHSDFLLKIQLGLEAEAYENIDSIRQTDILNAVKTLTKVEYGGLDVSGQRQAPAIDVRSNRYPKIATYSILQYSVWSANHPAAPLYTDSIPYTIKNYNYIYTGQNSDIIDLKINFDTTYYTSILAFTATKAAEESTRDTDVEIAGLGRANPVSLNPAIFAKINPQMGMVPSVTHMQYKFLMDNVNITGGMNLKDRPAALVTADVLNSIYSAQNQEMLNLDLTIVGDPTLIKQDDWLYIPDPENSDSFSDWSITSAEYSGKYGHVPFDRSEQAVRVTINSPIDMDTDISNEGLAYPNPQYSQSLFSGQYKILRIENKFANGKFEQVLHMVRLMNSSQTDAFSQLVNQTGRRDTLPSRNNDTSLIPTNPTSPSGDQNNDTQLPSPGATGDPRA